MGASFTKDTTLRVTPLKGGNRIYVRDLYRALAAMPNGGEIVGGSVHIYPPAVVLTIRTDNGRLEE